MSITVFVAKGILPDCSKCPATREECPDRNPSKCPNLFIGKDDKLNERALKLKSGMMLVYTTGNPMTDKMKEEMRSTLQKEACNALQCDSTGCLPVGIVILDRGGELDVLPKQSPAPDDKPERIKEDESKYQRCPFSFWFEPIDDETIRAACGLPTKEMKNHLEEYHKPEIIAALGQEGFKHSGCGGILAWYGEGISICEKCFMRFETKQIKEPHQ